MKLKVKLKLQAPLAVTAKKATSAHTAGLEFVPGTTWRGALAQAYLDQLGQPDARFRDWFTSGQLIFSDLVLGDENGPSSPIPMTAVTCKRFGGFKADERDRGQQAHGVMDILIPEIISKLTGQGPSAPIGKTYRYCPAPGCEERLEPLAGWYLHSQAGYRRLEVEKAIRAGTAIDSYTGTVQRGVLFSSDCLQEGQFLYGSISYRSKASQATEPSSLSQVLEDMARTLVFKGSSIHIGRAVSRGLGSCRVETVSLEKEELAPGNTVPDRCRRFNQEIAKRARLTEDQRLFSLTLQSRLIIVDDFLRYQVGISSSYLEKALDLPVGSIRPVFKAVRPVGVSGWNSAWGLPKEDELALAPGSVFAYQVDLGAAQVGEDELYARLALLEQEGIGERKAEGFGRVTVCDAFHWEVE